ncbi:AraC family transcriptional regulator [Paenibacillus tuaregi]|uniref:AraC family transcriptional regulator n=1 Tax=Paenibacillus tuaregi TaxID=1816681 RepID=UPI00083914DB|nr:AraC family transcriptional regulator [Paenibacillus tuaregi]
MSWISRMNEAIDYIECHLMDEVDYAEAARVACCSVYHFQRMFSFIAEVPLGEYVRRRRLTLAAFELQHQDIKIVDLALKYGYDSPEAFTRAFSSLHGVTPTAARKVGTTLKAYPKIAFHISIKGAVEMNYRMVELKPFRIVGISERVNTENAFSIIPQIWDNARSQGVFEELWNIRQEGHEVGGILGICANGEFGENEEFDYILAITSEHEPREGMVKFEYPASTWAVFDAPGHPGGIQEIWKRLYTEWVPSSSYDLAYLPAIENYLPPEEGRNELWVPVVAKKEATRD